MITVLTITYNRHHLLEEALESYLRQDFEDSEMLILNDKPDVEYSVDIPNVRIINHPYKFSSIMEKLYFGFQNSKYDYIYRLDDDDLLAPNALKECSEKIKNSDGSYDIFRSRCHYYLHNNNFSLGGSVNNGNIFRKEYFLNIEHPKISVNEDQHLLYNCSAKLLEYDFPSMIYRWGFNTYHISGMGIFDLKEIQKIVHNLGNENGHIKLNPHWNKDYWKQIKELIK